MPIAFLLQIGFGAMAIGMAFLIFVFTRAYLDPTKRLDRRYRVVAGSLAVGKVGVLIWAFNPLSQAFGGPPLHWILMGVATVLILFQTCALIGSTAIGGNQRILRFYVVLAVSWLVFCAAHWIANS